MRIAKTASAGISPRSSTMLNRRKTLMGGSPYRRRPLMFDQNGMVTAVSSGPSDRMQPPPVPNRPVSWHATSHMAPPSYPLSMAYPNSRLDFNGGYTTYDLAPTPAAYSGYNSPASTFSPLSQPFTDYRQQSFQYSDDSFFPSNFESSDNSYNPYQPVQESQQPGNNSFPTADNMDPSMYSHFDWSNFATNGFDTVTAPPTPDDFLPIQQPDPTFEPEESIPYHSLEDAEPGEVLVGMGLYDTPEKSPPADPQLGNYRSLMVSQVWGTVYKKAEPPTATGKGLKLEETWNPPPSDDGEDDDESNNDEDAEGSETDECQEDVVRLPVQSDNSTVHNSNGLANTGNGSEYHRDGWL